MRFSGNEENKLTIKVLPSMAATPPSNPSWTYKDDPDLADLIEIMSADERDQWNKGVGSLAQREEFLAEIEQRWRVKQKASGNIQPSRSPDENFARTQELIRGLRNDLDQLSRNRNAIPIKPEQPERPKVGSVRHSKKYYRRVRQSLFGVVGLLAAIILDRVNAPTWLIVVTLGVAVVCIPILPRVERAGKKVRAAFWLLLIAYVLFAGFVVLGKSQPSTSVATSQQAAPNLPSPSPIKEQFLSQADADYLVDLYKKYNSAQADEAVKTYIGKSIKVSGVVGDVSRDSNDRNSVTMTILVKRADGWTLYGVAATFDQQRWKDRALIFGRGEKIIVVGKFERASELTLSLGDCEIIE